MAFGAISNDILVFSDFGVKVTLWDLGTSRGVEVRDPKYGLGRCGWDIRPRTGHLACLTRGEGGDGLVVLGRGGKGCEVVRSVELGTVDARGVRWSGDGVWMAVWDAGCRGEWVGVFTADGCLFRTYVGLRGREGEGEGELGLGVRCVKWTAAGTLLVGDWNGRVVVLSKGFVSFASRD